MERFSRILIIIFVISLINLGLNGYLLTKVAKFEKTNIKTTTPQNTLLPTMEPKSTSQPIETSQSNIDDDLATIKAEIRSLREILGTTKTFAELNNLIKTIENNEQ